MSTIAPAPAAAAQRAPEPPGRRRRRSPLPYWLSIPAVLVLIAGMGYPLVWQVWNSFREYGLAQQFGQDPTFVGLDNYIQLLTDTGFWAVLAKSIVFMAVTALATMALGIGVALLMKAIHGWARVVLQIALLLAWAMPIVAQMTVWNWLINARNGVINHLLSLLPGVDMIGHNWLVEPLSFFAVASVIITWASVPFVALSVYAGLTQVSDEVLEASSLDGATGFQQLRLIIMPILRPVLVILLLLQMIWDLRVYAQIELLQGFGARGSKYDLLGTYIYSLGVGQGKFGVAAAAAMLVMLFTIALSWFYVRELLKEDKS
ncbi:carbohydrate ABC transporter permease [Demequina lignilytica]|uniref:Sugar ABC transporter permease n=1 Tax=Demequina lignilytica TaxID=3051663 RepID=A0AB35MG63_9MICO|nr:MULTISPECIES: sugar ABC transporter permease [unclassified Demequina]MDN4482718.1 sugar ABC transporter permease [Demequina sp. SYSU T0a273]MDN4490108.1 sugar ABC transporter permease [Demequina sp. SYSU T00068]